MLQIGYSLSSEEHSPTDLVRFAQRVTEDQVAESVVCGPDPEQHIAKIRSIAKAGANHVYVHQIGKDQEGFFRFYEREVLPEFGISRFSRAA